MTETPDCGRELLVVLGMPNCKRLAQKVQASFSHPKRASEVNEMKNHCQAPLPHCVSLEGISSCLQILSLTCQDIREIWREKIIAYSHAFQYWAEKSDLPNGGQPHWLAKSVKELQEKMSCYLSFSDKEVFKGISPLEGMSTTLVKEAEPHGIMAIPAATSKEQAAKEASQKPAKERKCPKFPG